MEQASFRPRACLRAYHHTVVPYWIKQFDLFPGTRGITYKYVA
jgi:hypothetical protein